MTTYERFEDVPVWKKAVYLAAGMFTWTTHSSFRGKGDLANQLQRAALSISNNIAEGFEQGSTAALIKYLYIARGSAGEVRSMLCVMERIHEFDDFEHKIKELKADFENTSRQIRGWTNSLQNSDIEGQRHLNDRGRERYEGKQRRKTFLKKQEEVRKEFDEKLNREAPGS